MRWMSAAVDQGCTIMSSAPNKGFCPCFEINTHTHAQGHVCTDGHINCAAHTHVSGTHTYLLRLLDPGSCYLSQANSLVSLVKLQLINLGSLCSVCLRVCIAQIGQEGSVGGRIPAWKLIFFGRANAEAQKGVCVL